MFFEGNLASIFDRISGPYKLSYYALVTCDLLSLAMRCTPYVVPGNSCIVFEVSPRQINGIRWKLVQVQLGVIVVVLVFFTYLFLLLFFFSFSFFLAGLPCFSYTIGKYLCQSLGETVNRRFVYTGGVNTDRQAALANKPHLILKKN